MTSNCNSAYDFLLKLATDDAFRQKVESDPKKVYAEYGLVLEPSELERGAKLPSKEEIRDKLEVYKDRAEKIEPLLFFFATRPSA